MKTLFLILLVAVASSAFAGGPLNPAFGLKVYNPDGSPWMEAIVYNGTNVPYATPINVSAGYWYDEGTVNRWATEFMPAPWPSGDYQWTGHIEVASSDLREELTFNWFRDDFQDLTWCLIVHDVDTRSLVTYQMIRPGDTGSGSFTTAMSRGGYDVVLAAFNEQPLDTPEPGSLLALGSGLVGLIGFGLRRRR